MRAAPGARPPPASARPPGQPATGPAIAGPPPPPGPERRTNGRERRREIWAGVRQGAIVAALGMALILPAVHLWPSAGGVPAARPGAVVEAVDFAAAQPPQDVRALARWAHGSRDHATMPFAIVDKRRAHLYVFSPAGRLVGHTPVLLGYTPGDHTVPGIGQRPLDRIGDHERTTPAGRFAAVSGRNDAQDPVIWVDYGSAVSMHRVRDVTAGENRLQRLATPTVDDNRVSFGCINVPTAFFDTVVWPALGGRHSIVYVLPEVEPFERVFPAAAAAA
jgi:hypothetical protein